MLLTNGFGARIELERDGVWTAAPEYKISNPNATTASCFIESVEGCKFRIVFQEESREHGIDQSMDLAIVFKVDGEDIQNFGFKPDKLILRTIALSGKPYGSSQVFPFVFGKVKLTDNDAEATRIEEVVKNVGSVQLCIYRVRLGGRKTPACSDRAARLTQNSSEDSIDAADFYDQPTEHALHERAKKGRVDHSTSYGATEAANNSSEVFCDTVYVDSVLSPWNKLEFRYRSGDLLEAENIKPSAPRPSTSTRAQTVDSSRADSGTEANARPSKRKPEESIRVKKEKMKKAGSSSGQVIDLDDSEDETEMQRLRRENEELRAKVKQEKPVKKEPATKTKGKLIDLSED